MPTTRRAVTMTIEAECFTTAAEAMQYADASGGEPILCDAGHVVVSKATLARMEAACVEFAHLTEHEGRIVTVPVN